MISLAFSRSVDKAVPAAVELHLICDNYGAHKPPKVNKWLLRHPRFPLQFTPPAAHGSTSCALPLSSVGVHRGDPLAGPGKVFAVMSLFACAAPEENEAW